MNGGGSIVLPMGVATAIVLTFLNLALSLSNIRVVDAERETKQRGDIEACQKEIERLRADLDHVRNVDVKILQSHQKDIEIAIEARKRKE